MGLSGYKHEARLSSQPLQGVGSAPALWVEKRRLQMAFTHALQPISSVLGNMPSPRFTVGRGCDVTAVLFGGGEELEAPGGPRLEEQGRSGW